MSCRTLYLWTLMVLSACGRGAPDATVDTDDTDVSTPAPVDTEVPVDTDTDEPVTACTEPPQRPRIPGDTDSDCVSGIRSTHPERDATGVYYRTQVEVVFNQDETSSAALCVGDEGGLAVRGSWDWSGDGKTVIFTPRRPLVPSTTYTTHLSYSCGKEVSVSFTTSDVGTPVDPSELLDKVYLADTASMRLIHPAGIGGLIGPLLADAGAAQLIAVQAGDTAGALRMVWAAADTSGDDPVQDLCKRTVRVDVPFADNPYWTFSDTDVSLFSLLLDVGGADIAHMSVAEGAFAPVGARIEGIATDSLIDTRVLDALDLGLDLGDQSLCDLAQTFSVHCEDCGDGATRCLRWTTRDMHADPVSLTVVERTQAQIDADPACGDGGG